MFDILNKYHELKNKSLKEKEVSEKVLLKLFIADGKSKEDAQFHVNIVKGLGGGVVIGDCKYTIKGKK